MHVARQGAHDRAAWVVAGAHAGAGRALVVLGEPGAGKSTLLEQALAHVDDAVVLRTTGVPVEQGLPHAALHGLLRPLDALLPDLPEVQRAALEVVLGLAAGTSPSPFLVGAATLTLLGAQADRTPVLVVVDDAQWVDDASLQALAFAGRRLAGERVGLLLAARTAEVPPALAGLERVVLDPLTPQEAAALVPGLSAAVAAALVSATRGNALALVERARGLDEAQRRGAAPLPELVDPLFVRHVARLPGPVLEAAAQAALAEDAPPAVLAAARREVDLAPAEDAGLLVTGADGVRWRHPLARAAVLDALPPGRRRALSAELAQAAARVGAPEAVVVELRLAALEGPDEALAADLERVAAASADGGDHDRAARLWVRAAEVGTDAGRHGVRLFRSAEELLAAGRVSSARAQYRAAVDAGLDAASRARTHLALGRIEHTAGTPARALREFQAAASAPEVEVRLRACAEGVAAAMYAGATDVAAAFARQARDAHDPADAAQRLVVLHVEGAAAALAGDLEAARPLLAGVVEQAATSDVLERHPELVLWVVVAELFRGGTSDLGMDVAAPALEQLRLRGDLTWLPRVVRLWGVRHEMAGRWLTAYATYEEAVELSRAAEQPTQLVEALRALALLEAVRGEGEACLAHAAEIEHLLARLDVPFLSSSAWLARGLLHLGLGEPGAAAAALAPAVALPPGVRFRAEAVADLVEALVADGQHAAAEQAARAAPSLRTAGLLAHDDARAVRHLLEAADETDPLTGARCRLIAGERLRRAGLRVEARTHLRAARDVFSRAGAAPWLRRAEEGLRASGETLTARDEHPEALTGAELRVAALVAEGRPTREVATLLFLSPKTVEFHLSRIYRKLGVRGRAELARVMAEA